MLTAVVGYEKVHAEIVRPDRTQHWEVTAFMTAPETHSTPQQRSRKHVFVINGSPDFLRVHPGAGDAGGAADTESRQGR
jgi:hypothetical protein